MGRKLSQETKQKIRKAARRRLATSEGREQLRRAAEKAWEARRGLKESDELREKRAAIVQRRMQNPEEQKKILACLGMASSRKGWISEEHKAKVSKAHKGKPKSKTHREKLRMANLGKKQSIETRRKRSETLKGMDLSKRNKGRKHSEETKRKMSEAHKRRFERPGEREKQAERNRKRWARHGNKHDPETIAKMKAARARQVIPLQDTKPEQAVQDILDLHGIKYRKHKTIRRLPFHQWDFVIDDLKLLIEVDGCYWHGCELCIPKERRKIGEQNRRRDALYDTAAEEENWSVLRIWEHELAEGKTECIILTRANTRKRRNAKLSNP